MGGKMKRITLLAAAAIACGFIQGASAADLAVKAAPPPPAPLWTGFYVGVHAGAAWQSAPDWTLTTVNPTLLLTQGLASDARLGAVGGIQGGYNWQFAPTWLVGVEGDFSWAHLNDNRTAPLLPVIPGDTVQMAANTQWLASARAKFGFIGWNTLWYVTGGGAWVNTEYTGNTAIFLGAAPAGLAQAQTSFHTTKSGWVVGGGAEWMATTNILLRVEYLYYGFDNNTSAGAAFVPAVGPGVTYNWDKYNVQVARIALSYKFDWLSGRY